MEEKKKELEFSETIAAALDRERIMADVETFSRLERYSGSSEGEDAAAIIAERMEQLEIPVKREVYEIYRSLPGEASVTVEGRDGKKTFLVTPYVYSGQADSLNAALVFDELSTGSYGQRERKESMKAFKGKVVLTYESSFSFACEAKAAGALGVLTIWHENLAHHGTLGGVWGTPEPEDLKYHYPRIPFAEVCRDDGEYLKKISVENDGTEVVLTVKMDERILPSTMPVAFIKGKSDKFVLVSGHYDSWYEGVTDNGVANAAMMEMARVFKQYEGMLERSIMFAWWSGHSDGRYSGSAWYYDNHWQELKENCVAHINMDICGCKGSDLVGFNSSLLEGAEFVRDFLKEFNEAEPIPAVPMARFADQTFWGADLPFAIMPKFSKRDKTKMPFYWWHTKEDTFDKVDGEIALRDAKVIGKLAAVFTNIKRLPARLHEFTAIMEARLRYIEKGLSKDFDLTQVYPYMERLKVKMEQIENMLPEYPETDTDKVIKRIAGELVRISYTASSPYHQDPAVEAGMFPALTEAMGLTRENTCEDYYLAAQTRFIRQRNRLAGQIEKVLGDCENQIFWWGILEKSRCVQK